MRSLDRRKKQEEIKFVQPLGGEHTKVIFVKQTFVENRSYHGHVLMQCLVQKFSNEKFWQKPKILKILRSKGEGDSQTNDFSNDLCTFSLLSSVATPNKNCRFCGYEIFI